MIRDSLKQKGRIARSVVGCLAIGAAFWTAACSKAGGTTETPAPTAAAPVAEALPRTPEGVLTGYENIRRMLAEDQVAAVFALAKQLSAAAAAVASARPTPQAALFERIATASALLATTDAKDADAVRRQFGEVSHAVVDLLTTDTGLRGSRLVFECPMAQGYRKWVQLTSTINNPYMGSKMLECGVAANWTP